jgi:hypothetical protein
MLNSALDTRGLNFILNFMPLFDKNLECFELTKGGVLDMIIDKKFDTEPCWISKRGKPVKIWHGPTTVSA